MLYPSDVFLFHLFHALSIGLLSRWVAAGIVLINEESQFHWKLSRFPAPSTPTIPFHGVGRVIF